MSATITSQFRKNNAIALITEAATLAAANTTGTGIGYWIGIGKSDPWPGGTNETDIELPGSNPNSSADALGNLITLRKVIDSNSTDATKPALVYPANQWMNGRIYKVYDPTDDLCYYSSESQSTVHYPCYVHSGLKVFLCLARPSLTGTSTTDPNNVTGISIGNTFTNTTATDGYTWVYLYELSTSSPFNTSTFKAIPATPTQTVTGAKGMCFSMRIVNGGTGYTTATPPTVTISASDANGATITATAANVSITITGTVITHITFTCAAVGMKRASAVITGGSGTNAVIIPLLTPIGGAASNLRDILPCWYAAFYAKFDPSDSDNNASVNSNIVYPDLVNTISYRQVSLIRNPIRTQPLVNEDANALTPNSMDCLRYLTTTTTTTLPATFSSQIITQGTTKAYLDYITLTPAINPTDKRIYYHQNSNSSDVNLAGFTNTAISIPNAAALNGTITPFPSEYQHGSGEVLFLENRQSISRNSNQSEEIKLIIQL